MCFGEVVKFYVYVLSDQGTPFYVGKGTGDRAFVHERVVLGTAQDYNHTHDYNPYKTRKIKQIIEEGREIEYSFPFRSGSEADTLSKEVELIKRYGRKGLDPEGILTNRTMGGVGGNIIGTLTPEKKQAFKKKLSVAFKGWTGRSQSFLGKTHGPEAREAISKANRGNSKGAKHFDICSPDGVRHKGTNVSLFAREHGLSEEMMRAVVAGRKKSHRGWTCYT